MTEIAILSPKIPQNTILTNCSNAGIEMPLKRH